MNMLTKMTLTALTIATLTGCASVPQAPKDAKEMAELGDDNLLNVPVDITPFLNTARKVKIVSEEDKDACAGLLCSGFGRDGDVGQTTIFTNPADGKMYDEDGQPVNEKGERILKNGYVCKVRMIMNNQRAFAPGNINTGTFGMNDCRPKRGAQFTANAQKRVNTAVLFAVTTGGAGALAIGVGAAAVNVTIANITEGDTF